MNTSSLRSTLLLITILALGAPMLTSCKTAAKVAEQATETGANLLLPPEQETELGKQLSAELEKEVKLHPSPEVQAYIQELGNEIVRAAGPSVPEGITFTFKVIDDPDTVNAFAMPGGYIYFYSGLLLKAENTSEVIGVMGHEVAHVTERHVAERLVKAYGLQALANMALGKNPGQVKQLVAGLLAQGYLLKYGREQESESDKVGLAYVLRDNKYDPIGMATFFQKLDEGGASVPTIVSSHPDPGERAKRIRELLAAQTNVPENLGTERHQGLYPQFKMSAGTSTPAQTTTEETTPAP